MSTQRTQTPDSVDIAHHRAFALDPLENTIGASRSLGLCSWNGSSCPRPWKNASEEAVDALGFAGMTVEIPVELADACGLSEAIRF
jgi:hypothetical protein